MARAVKAELLKFATTRAIYGLLAGELGVVLLTTGSTVASADSTSLSGDLHRQVFFLLVSINVGIFSLIVGMRAVTDEYRHSTIAHAFLADPQRRRTMLAKATASGLVAAGLAVVAAGAMVALALPLASAKGGALVFSRTDVAASAGFVAANALWAIMGVGVAAVVRHQVAAIVGGVVWILVMENLGSGFLGEAGRYLPGQAAYALGQAVGAATALPVASAALVLGLYATAAFGAGLFFTRRRDVL